MHGLSFAETVRNGLVLDRRLKRQSL